TSATTAESAQATSRAVGAQTVSSILASGEFETRLFNRINHRRANHGCRAFRSNAALTLASDRHSRLMVSAGDLSHQLRGEAGLGTRVTQAGYTHWRIIAENLAWGQSTPRAVFRAWVHSAGHRANLDNCRLRDIGISVVISGGRPWVTADFGRRRS
ncbi:MAG TPA: CAP domain-containing protein, partial [Marmoricola sp.]|nr:CAP domain-containing protein [Marmoricola sp.]